MNGEDPALWRLDSLAQDMRSIAVDQDNGKQLQPKGSLTGLFKGFSALSSNVKSTKGQLQRIMTVQLAALPLNSDDSATSKDNLPGTASSNKSIAPSGLSPTQHASDAGTPGAAPEAAALTAAADLALQEAADDLKSSVTAGIPTHAQQIHTIPQTIYEGQTLSTTSSGVSALDADISVFAAYGATRGPSFTAAIGGTPLSGTPSRSGSQTAFSVGRTVSPMSSHVSPRLSRRFTNMSRSSGVRLQPSATLQRMETSNAWWELHELEKQQSCNSAADTDDDFVLDEEQYSSIAELLQQPKAAALPAAPTQSGNNQDASKLNGSRSSSTFGSGLLKTLGGLTSGSFVGGVTAKLAAVLNIVSNNNTPIYSGHLKKAPHTTVSTDGWTLHLLHIRDTSLRAEQRRNYPILMCPGLASSGTGTFDLLPKESIADFLAADGYDVWVIDLRGNGKADKQSRVDLELEWNIDDYLVQDVPAVIEYVLKQTKAEMLHWMGHSMGGMLGSGLCSQGGKWGRKLRSVMLVGSGCFGDGSWHVLLKKLVAPIVTFGFPAHYSCQALALLSNTPAALSVFETLFYWCPNMDKSARKALLHTCFNFIPQRLLGQFLASHGSAEGLSSWNGNFLYADPDVLAKCKVPCLGLNGDYDLFCPAAGGAKNVLLFGGPKKHLVFGPSYGHEFHYGHFDVIIGKNAQLEVWPNIQEWLAEHDEPVMSANDLWDDLDKES